MTFLTAKNSHLQAQIYEGEIISYSFPPARKRLYNIVLTCNALNGALFAAPQARIAKSVT